MKERADTVGIDLFFIFFMELVNIFVRRGRGVHIYFLIAP